MEAKFIFKVKQKALLVCDRAFFVLMGKTQKFVFVGSLLVVLSFFAGSILEVKAEGMDLYEQQKITSHLLINLFLENVDKEELVIFEHVLGRSDLKSHQVAYVYNVADDSLIVRLCFRLQKKILVPKFENFFVDGITVETDVDGNILKITTHVSPIENEDPK